MDASKRGWTLLQRLICCVFLGTAPIWVGCGGGGSGEGEGAESGEGPGGDGTEGSEGGLPGDESLGFLTTLPPIAVQGTPYAHELVIRGQGTLALKAGPPWLALNEGNLVGTPTLADLGRAEVVVELEGSGPQAGKSARLEGTILVLVAEDADGDGLDNFAELQLGTDPENADTDGDGKPDGAEVGDPAAPNDADGDGIIDALEAAHVDNDQDGIVDELDPADSGEWQLTKLGFWPQVIANDGVDSATAEVVLVNAPAGARVWLARSQDADAPGGPGLPQGLLHDGAPVGTSRVELFDDGTRGDRVASDGIYSRHGFTTNQSGLYVGGKLDSASLDEIIVEVGGESQMRRVWDGYKAGRSVFPSGRMTLGFIEASEVRLPAALGASAQALPHVLNLVAPLEAVDVTAFLLTLPGSTLRRASAKVLAVLEDEYDFLYLLAERPAFGRAAGRQETCRNAVQGIGRPIFDAGQDYGSAARLQGALALDFATNGPTLHETAHQWAVFLDSSFGFDGTHWGYAGTQGQLGGFDPASLVDNGDGTYTTDRFGTFANRGDGQGYGAWELYLMGLLPAGEVPTIPVLQGAKLVSQTAAKTTMSATGIKQVSVDDVIAAHGPRSPAAPAAQSQFNGAWVVVSQKPLTAAELSWVEVRSALFGAPQGDGFLYSFEQATGGRGSMDTSLGLD